MSPVFKTAGVNASLRNGEIAVEAGVVFERRHACFAVDRCRAAIVGIPAAARLREERLVS